MGYPPASPPANSSAPLTRRIAEFVTAAETELLSDRSIDFAERALVDTVAVAVAASRDAGQHALWSAVGPTLPPGPAHVLTCPVQTSPRDAALLNGAAAHALDFDDVTDSLIAHPSAVIMSAALAVAEQQCSTGRELLDAYCVGFQVECAIGEGLPIVDHYGQGWHTTSTLGVFGATAASARLLGLSADQVQAAIGVAVSLAGGSRANFGTMTKPLHAGLAASHGVLAASLGAVDFTSAPDALEGPLGFFRLFGSDTDLGKAATKLHSGWVLERGELNIKRHACCYYAQRIADAALELVRQGVRGSDVDDVMVTLEPGGCAPLIHDRPTNGLQAKFSAQFVAATCLLDGEIGLNSFADSMVLRPDMQALIARVRVCEAAVPPFGPKAWERGYAVVSAELRSGTTVVHRIDIPLGHAKAPLTEAQLFSKFTDCLTYGECDPRQIGTLYRSLRNARHARSVSSMLTLHSTSLVGS